MILKSSGPSQEAMDPKLINVNATPHIHLAVQWTKYFYIYLFIYLSLSVPIMKILS